MVKGILKRYARPAGSRSENNNTCIPEEVDSPKKRVSFDSPDLVKVFQADEWDRSPAQVTLKLTCKDVAELRELNISLIRPGPLAMERTKSKRPTPRSATPQSPSLNLFDSTAFQPNAPPRYTPVTRPSSPMPAFKTSSSSSPIPLTLPKHLPRLLEDPFDAYQASTVVNGNDKCDEFEENSSLLIRPPPGLPVRTVPSSTSRSSVPPSSSRSFPPVTTTIPLYRPPHLRAKLANPLVKPQDGPAFVAAQAVTRSFSEKVVIDPETHSSSILLSSSLKAYKLVDLEGKAESVSLVLNKDSDKNATSVNISSVPVLSRKPSRGLMGWELKRSTNNAGKLGFGLIRKQPINTLKSEGVEQRTFGLDSESKI